MTAASLRGNVLPVVGSLEFYVLATKSTQKTNKPVWAKQNTFACLIFTASYHFETSVLISKQEPEYKHSHCRS